MPRVSTQRSLGTSTTSPAAAAMLKIAMRAPTAKRPHNTGFSAQTAGELVSFLMREDPDNADTGANETILDRMKQSFPIWAIPGAVCGQHCRFPFPDIESIVELNLRLVWLDPSHPDYQAKRQDAASAGHLWQETVGSVVHEYRDYTAGEGLWFWCDRVASTIIKLGATEGQFEEVWPSMLDFRAEMLGRWIEACTTDDAQWCFPDRGDHETTINSTAREIAQSHEWLEQSRTDKVERDSSDRRRAEATITQRLQEPELTPSTTVADQMCGSPEAEAKARKRMQKHIAAMARTKRPDLRQSKSEAMLLYLETLADLDYTVKQELSVQVVNDA